MAAQQQTTRKKKAASRQYFTEALTEEEIEKNCSPESIMAATKTEEFMRKYFHPSCRVELGIEYRNGVPTIDPDRKIEVITQPWTKEGSDELSAYITGKRLLTPNVVVSNSVLTRFMAKFIEHNLGDMEIEDFKDSVRAKVNAWLTNCRLGDETFKGLSEIEAEASEELFNLFNRGISYLNGQDVIAWLVNSVDSELTKKGASVRYKSTTRCFMTKGQMNTLWHFGSSPFVAAKKPERKDRDTTSEPVHDEADILAPEEGSDNG